MAVVIILSVPLFVVGLIALAVVGLIALAAVILKYGLLAVVSILTASVVFVGRLFGMLPKRVSRAISTTTKVAAITVGVIVAIIVSLFLLQFSIIAIPVAIIGFFWLMSDYNKSRDARIKRLVKEALAEAK